MIYVYVGSHDQVYQKVYQVFPARGLIIRNVSGPLNTFDSSLFSGVDKVNKIII